MAAGATPLELYSGYSGFQPGSNAMLFGQHAAGADKNLWLSQNSWADGSGNEVAISTGTGSVIHQSSGNMDFYCFNSTSANATITKRYHWRYVRDSDTAVSAKYGNYVGDGTGQGVRLSSDAQQGLLQIETSLTTERVMVYFRNGNNIVGTIKTSGTGTSYNTSSDYRLKANVDYSWNATNRLKALKPARFNFLSEANTTIDGLLLDGTNGSSADAGGLIVLEDETVVIEGFLAHEVEDIVSDAVTGSKDGIQHWEEIIDGELPDGVSEGDVKLDDYGNTIPEHQSIDHSKLVPLLVKTIQELEARITALEG